MPVETAAVNNGIRHIISKEPYHFGSRVPENWGMAQHV